MTASQPNSSEVSAIAPQMPVADSLSQFFWDGVNKHQLLILQCNHCGKFIHWPRDLCRFCLSTDLSPTVVSGRATLDTWTEPYQSADPYFAARVPYILAIVELPEQEHLKLVTNIVDCPADDLRIGMDLTVDFREVAPGLTLPLFRPSAGPQGGPQ